MTHAAASELRHLRPGQAGEFDCASFGRPAILRHWTAPRAELRKDSNVTGTATVVEPLTLVSALAESAAAIQAALEAAPGGGETRRAHRAERLEAYGEFQRAAHESSTLAIVARCARGSEGFRAFVVKHRRALLLTANVTEDLVKKSDGGSLAKLPSLCDGVLP
jgi:hypothetical protein